MDTLYTLYIYEKRSVWLKNAEKKMNRTRAYSLKYNSNGRDRLSGTSSPGAKR